MHKSQFLPLVSDLPLSTRSDNAVLGAIEIEINGLKMAQAALDEATAQLNGSMPDGGAAKADRPPPRAVP